MIYQGDCLNILKTLPDVSVNCCVTSPPYYGLRDYGCEGQIGLEETPEAFVEKLVAVFREVKRVLRDDGTLWLNLGDSYAGSGKGIGGLDHGKAVFTDGEITKTDWSKTGLKPKDLIGIPWRVAFALQADGWYLRQDIIWHKPNPMPESVKDRCTKSHEYIFLLSKSAKYFYDNNAIREDFADERMGNPGTSSGKYSLCSGRNDKGALGGGDGWDKGEKLGGRNHRSVWTIPTHAYKEAHFATFPEKLVEPCIKAGCPVGGVVLDPFFGAGTVGLVATKLGREYIGIELNPAYVEISEKRITNVQQCFEMAI